MESKDLRFRPSTFSIDLWDGLLRLCGILLISYPSARINPPNASMALIATAHYFVECLLFRNIGLNRDKIGSTDDANSSSGCRPGHPRPAGTGVAGYGRPH